MFEGKRFASDEATGDIRVFSEFADVAPLRVISTAHMGIGSLGQIAVSRDEIYVVNNVTHRVDVFPINGNGAIAPNRSLAGIGTPDARSSRSASRCSGHRRGSPSGCLLASKMRGR